MGVRKCILQCEPAHEGSRKKLWTAVQTCAQIRMCLLEMLKIRASLDDTRVGEIVQGR